MTPVMFIIKCIMKDIAMSRRGVNCDAWEEILLKRAKVSTLM